MTGDQLLGVAAILTGIAAVITSLRSGSKTARVDAKTERVLDAVGERNGNGDDESVRDIALEIKSLVEFIHDQSAYQHTRNHDILGGIAKMNMAVPLLIDLVETLMPLLREMALAQPIIVDYIASQQED